MGGARACRVVLALAPITVWTCCGGSGGGGPSAGAVAAVSSGAAVGSSSGAAVGSSSAAPVPSAVDFARLAREAEDRADDYLAYAAGGGSYYAQIARLSVNGGPVDRRPLEALMDFMDARRDTADFKATALVRLVHLHGGHPDLPSDLKDRAERTLLGFKYWVDEPGQDEMIFWSENHQIMFAAAEYLAGQRYPNQTFTNSGLTGAEHVRKARPRILRWLDERFRYGFSEFYSPVYYPHTMAPLLNLVDFAADAEVRTKAAMALDLMLFDVARLSQDGNFGVPAGRAYEEHKWDGRDQGTGDVAEILWGERGIWRDRGGTGGTSFATSTYRPPHALLGIGRDRPARLVDRARMGTDFQEAAGHGIGLQDLDDGMFWWGMGGYVAPDTIVLSRDMIRAWDLWHYPFFQPFDRTRFVPDAALPALSGSLSPVSEGPLLTTADLYAFRTPDAMLSSVQSWRPGQVAFQQHAWQATLGMDAVVWTTAPGTLGRDGPGEWTGSASLPRVVQVEDVAVILYDPATVLRAIFPPLTHAWFPRAAFDEVVTRGLWTFAREGEGYVALYSARPARWKRTGPFADRELWASGWRNVWVCQVGNEAEDGSFADFVAAVSSAPIRAQGQGYTRHGARLDVVYEAPGLGQLDVAWRGTPTLDGRPLPVGGFPRFDNPYARMDRFDDALEVRFAGAVLRHDYAAGARSGDGL